MKPDPNRHEASRPAFEKLFDGMSPRDLELRRHEIHDDVYYWESTQNRWEDWCRALEWQAAQVCGWTPQGQDGENGYRAECGQWWHWHFKMTSKCCPTCGRRVKIQYSETTTNTNK